MRIFKSLSCVVSSFAMVLGLLVFSEVETFAVENVVSTIPMAGLLSGMAIDSAGQFGYVAISSTNSVAKINLSSGYSVGEVSVGVQPAAVVINPAGTFAYVANNKTCSSSPCPVPTVSKIDLSTFTVASTFNVGYGNNRAIAIDPTGHYLYVVDGGNTGRINLVTETLEANFPAGTDPRAIVIDPLGQFAYVANYGSAIPGGTVSKLDLSTGDQNNVGSVSTIDTGGNPTAIALDKSGTNLYVTQSSLNTVQQVNISTGVKKSLPTSSVPGGLLVNDSGSFLYVAVNSGGIDKINLSSNAQYFALRQTFSVGDHPSSVFKESNGTALYILDSATSVAIKKFRLDATQPQTISFTTVGKAVVPAPLTQLFGTKSVIVAASASSGLSVSFSSATESVCTVSGTTVTFVSTGDCTVNADQAGGQGWDAATQVPRTFTILPSPPSGEVGVSINSGDSYTNSKSVLLNLIWPEYATEARVSNDGGFASAKTSVLKLAPSVKWELDDSVKGVYTKVVYVRFSGIGDTAKSYTDDIILDTTAPVVESSTARAASGAIEVTLKATDDITGVDKVQIKNGTTTVTKEYSTKISVSEKEIGLTVSSSGVRKMATTSIDISVSDKAGNWSTFKTLSVAGTLTTTTATTPTTTSTTGTTSTVTTQSGAMPKVTTSKSTTAKSIAAYAKITISSTSKVSLKVVSAYAKYCKVSGTTLKGLKAGSCKVTVTVTPKKGRAISKTVTLKITK